MVSLLRYCASRRVADATKVATRAATNVHLMSIPPHPVRTFPFEERTRDGKHYLVMVDPVAFREGAGRLLAEVQRIKSEGDAAAAARLFDMYGIHFDPALRDEVVRRVDALTLPSYTGFVMPKLTPVMGPDGRITDVTISYPMDLTTQMLEYSGRRP